MTKHLVTAVFLVCASPSFAQDQGLDLTTAANVTPEVTLDQLIAAWGEGYYREYAGFYRFRTPSREDVWVSVSKADRNRIVRVVYWPESLGGFDWPVPESRVEVFNLMEKTKHRSCRQFRGRNKVSLSELRKVWGPADGESGSGFAFEHYVLEDGTEVVFNISASREFLRGVCWNWRGRYVGLSPRG